MKILASDLIICRDFFVRFGFAFVSNHQRCKLERSVVKKEKAESDSV